MGPTPRVNRACPFTPQVLPNGMKIFHQALSVKHHYLYRKVKSSIGSIFGVGPRHPGTVRQQNSVSTSDCSKDEVTQADVYLELNLDNILEAFCDFWLLESRCKAHKGRVRKDTSFLGIKAAGSECSNRVVVLA